MLLLKLDSSLFSSILGVVDIFNKDISSPLVSSFVSLFVLSLIDKSSISKISSFLDSFIFTLFGLDSLVSPF